MKKNYLEMFKKDVEIALNAVRDAHKGYWPEPNTAQYKDEGEPPCEIGSERWYQRIEDILWVQFEGAYMYLDFLQSQGKIEDDDKEPEYDDGFEF